MERFGGSSRTWAKRLAPPALFVLAFAVRALPSQTVWIHDRIQFFGNDAYYHMRRIVHSIVHFPSTLEFDRYINFPHGGKPIWTPFFDWGVALALRPFWGTLSPPEMERLAVWVPPALGSATVVALYFLAKRHFGGSIALIAGAILSVLSAHFWYSQVGFIDHHAAVALATTVALAASMSLLARSSREPRGVRSAWRLSAGTGIALAAAILLWPGSLLHVGLIETGCLAFLLTRSERDDAIAFALRLAVVHAVAFALIVPFGVPSRWPQWGRFSPVVLSAFQPWYFGTAALFCLGCAECWRRPRFGGSQWRRGSTGLAIGAVLLAGSAWLFPSLPSGVEDVWEWSAKRDSFQAHVAESGPLFIVQDRFSFGIAFVRLSPFVLAIPLALAVAYRASRRDPHRAPVLLYLWWTLGLSVVTVLQKRFFNSASVAIALLLALSIRWAYGVIPAGWLRSGRARRAAKLTLAAGTLLLLLPVLVTYAPLVSNQLGRFQGRDPRVTADFLIKEAAIETAQWLRIHTPQTSGWLDPSRRPEYGVLAPWTIGHILEYVARRPTVNDNFGDDIGVENFMLVRRYYQSEEATAVKLLDRLGVRYVISQRYSPYLGEEPLPGSMFFALFHHDGSEFDPPLAPHEIGSGKALEQHRMIYESLPLVETQPPGESVFKVFEYVRGARVVGRAAPGARIRAKLLLRTNRGRTFLYDARSEATPAGRYEFRVPYATRGSPPAIVVASHYTFECGGENAAVGIDERDVQSGAVVAGPDICLTR